MSLRSGLASSTDSVPPGCCGGGGALLGGGGACCVLRTQSGRFRLSIVSSRGGWEEPVDGGRMAVCQSTPRSKCAAALQTCLVSRAAGKKGARSPGPGRERRRRRRPWRWWLIFLVSDKLIKAEEESEKREARRRREGRRRKGVEPRPYTSTRCQVHKCTPRPRSDRFRARHHGACPKTLWMVTRSNEIDPLDRGWDFRRTFRGGD